MSHLLTHTLRALQFYHGKEPVKAPSTTVAKHSCSRDRTTEQKQHQTVEKTMREGSDHLWLKHTAVINAHMLSTVKAVTREKL